MIRETEVKQILQKNNPEFKIELPGIKSLYKIIGSFAAYTKELIKQGNLPLIRQSFDTIEHLLKKEPET